MSKIIQNVDEIKKILEDDLDFSGCEIYFDGVISNLDFRGANFTNAFLALCRFEYCTFNYTSFIKADLRWSNFRWCYFHRTSFVNADLTGAIFRDSKFDQAALDRFKPSFYCNTLMSVILSQHAKTDDEIAYAKNWNENIRDDMWEYYSNHNSDIYKLVPFYNYRWALHVLSSYITPDYDRKWIPEFLLKFAIDTYRLEANADHGK